MGACARQLRRHGDPARSIRGGEAAVARAARGRRRRRMHRLRHLLRGLRRGRMESRLSRARRPQSRVDARERRARWRQRRAPRGGGGRRRLPFVPHAHELHRALSEGALTHALDRRPQARDHRARARAGRRRSMSRHREVALWVAQRATAVVLAFCVMVHLATIIYAVRGGLSAGDVLARTRGNVAWASFYVIFVIAAAVHGAIGLRTVAAEWLGFRGGAAGVVVTLVGGALTIMGLRAVAAGVGAGEPCAT